MYGITECNVIGIQQFKEKNFFFLNFLMKKQTIKKTKERERKEIEAKS